MIERFSERHLEEVVELHHRVLSWSINSRLGKAHIYNLYHTLLKDENAAGFVYITKDKVFGVVTGTLQYSQTREKLESNYSFSDKFKLFFMMFNPKNAIYILENVFLIPGFLKKNANIPGQIITLVTDDNEAVRPFAAVKCFNAIKNFFSENKLTEIFAQVASFDLPPNNFYRKGLKLIPVKKYFRNYIYKIKI